MPSNEQQYGHIISTIHRSLGESTLHAMCGLEFKGDTNNDYTLIFNSEHIAYQIVNATCLECRRKWSFNLTGIDCDTTEAIRNEFINNEFPFARK